MRGKFSWSAFLVVYGFFGLIWIGEWVAAFYCYRPETPNYFMPLSIVLLVGQALLLLRHAIVSLRDRHITIIHAKDYDMMQPDLHHEGPLTQELLTGLRDKILSAIAELDNFNSPDADWQHCKGNWRESLTYAGLRLAAISTKLEFNITHREDEDRKCIDITLCILRDFEQAKAQGFENADHISL